MGLSWLSPLFLTGILLLVIPVLIHLKQKQRQVGFKFPSLMFLKKIAYREKRRLEIRNWLLLILRCILLLLIAIAFARPYFATGISKTLLNLERQDSVIVIDRSYSMRISNHWQQAQEIALKLLDEKKPLDRIALIIFDDKAEVLSELTSDTDNLRSIIKRKQPGFRSTELRPAIEQAARLLSSNDANQKKILIISDFQASAASTGGPPEIPNDILLETFVIKFSDVTNTTISSFAIKPMVSETQQKFSFSLELTNHSSLEVSQQISLKLNGRELQRRDLLLESAAVVAEHFEGLSLNPGLNRGVVSLNPDDLTLDNQFYFTYSRNQQVPVLILEGAQPRDNQSVYLESALRLSRNPVFQVTRRPMDKLKAEDLSKQAVVIINDVSIPGAEAGKALLTFIRAGGGLMVATGDAQQGNWPSAENEYLPGTLLPRVDSKPGKAYNITDFEPDHVLSNIFAAKGHIDLSAARIFNYRTMRPKPADRVIGRYNDGAVALLERQVGLGRTLVLTTTLDTFWNDLAVQPVFLPFLHHSIRYLARFESIPAGFEVGAVVDVMRYARVVAGAGAIVPAAQDSALIVELPSAKEVRLNRRTALLTLEEPGFYQIHRATTPNTTEVVLAANINPVEADLIPLDVERFVEEIMTSASPRSRSVAYTQRQADEHELQQQIWFVILIAALALMLVEAFVANWISFRRAIKTQRLREET